MMRNFNLIRHEDVTGVSGPGVVAEGVVFSAGHVAMTWFEPVAGGCNLYKDVQHVLEVHGHNGKTEVKFVN